MYSHANKGKGGFKHLGMTNIVCMSVESDISRGVYINSLIRILKTLFLMVTKKSDIAHIQYKFWIIKYNKI